MSAAEQQARRRRATCAALAGVLGEDELLQALWLQHDHMHGDSVNDIISCIDRLAIQYGWDAGLRKTLYDGLYRALRKPDAELPIDPWPAMLALRPAAAAPARPAWPSAPSQPAWGGPGTGTYPGAGYPAAAQAPGGYPQGGWPAGGYPPGAYPPGAAVPGAYPPAGYPPGGSVPGAYPQPGYPPAGYPPAGYPPGGPGAYPPAGYPQPAQAPAGSVPGGDPAAAHPPAADAAAGPARSPVTSSAAAEAPAPSAPAPAPAPSAAPAAAPGWTPQSGIAAERVVFAEVVCALALDVARGHARDFEDWRAALREQWAPLKLPAEAKAALARALDDLAPAAASEAQRQAWRLDLPAASLIALVHALYVALCESIGPVAADQALTRAIKLAEEGPAARVFSPRRFL